VTKNKNCLIGILIITVIAICAFPASAFAASDKTPPELTVTLSEGTLTVKATDDASGVAAVYVDGHRINALTDGNAAVNLKDYAGNTAKVMVYATDGAGNRSKTQEISNPYYQPPAPLPAQEITPTQTPSASAQGSAVARAQADTNEPAQTGEQDAASGRNADGSVTPSETGALAPNGTGTVIESATDKDGKEFYTITTKAGNVFYLVIDRQKADGGVYFLNAVTESDLAALAQKEGEGMGAGIFGGGADSTGEPQEADEPEPEKEPAPAPDPDPEKKNTPIGTVIFVLLAVAAAGGAGYYIKIVRPRKQAASEDSDDDWADFFSEDEDQKEDVFSPENREVITEDFTDDDLYGLTEEPRE
jgi:hypothetical protein